MAQTVISGGDLVKLRSNQSIPDLSLFITPLQSVVTGTITAVPSKYPSVSLSVSWDSSTSATSIGQLVKISNGDTIRAYSVIRKSISGSTLYLSETPLGAYGYATMIESPILVGDVVTIYNHRPLWGMYSRIDAKTKTFYKQWDVPYSDQNEGDTIVANAGAWQAAKLEGSDTTARFTLPRGGVNTSFEIGGNSLDSIAWVLPSGVTLVAGYALSDEVIEVDAVAGSYLVSMTATIGAKSHTAYLWLFVSDGTNHLSATNAVSLPQSDSQSRLGREMAFQVYGDNLQDTIYPGAGFLLREWPHYDAGDVTDGIGIDSFIGYISDIQFSHDGNIGSATFKVESPMIYAARIAQPPQSLEEVSEATSWINCESVLSNPCGFAYYLIRWHTPALLENHDFNAWDYASPRRKYLQCNNSRNLGANLAVVAGYLAGNIGSASDGTTVLRPNPLYMTQTNRDLVDTILEFQDSDIAAPLTYARRLVNALAEVRGGAFAFSGTGNPKAWYVGKRWNQGSGSSDMPNFTVAVTEGLNEAKSKIGHFFAEQNAEIEEIGLDLTLNIDVLDPAYMLWAAFTIDSQYDPYGQGFVSSRILPNTIEREWSLDGGNIIKRIKVRSQGETFGQAGEELPIGANTNQNGFSNGTPVLWQPHSSSGLFSGEKSPPILLAHNRDGDFASLLNYMATNPQWADLRNPLNDEAVNDWCLDYASAYFSSGGDSSRALGAYAITMDSGDAHIWYFADILRSNSAENVKTLSLSDATLTTEARIICSESYPSLVLAGVKDGTGTRFSRSTDSGATFGSLTRVGSAITDSINNDNAPFGMAVDGQRQLITAPDATPVYGTYLATTAAGSFSKLSNSEDNPYPMPMIAIEPDGTTAYVAGKTPESAVITFDTPSWAQEGGNLNDGTQHWYIYNSFWLHTGSVTSGGNPNNCAKWSGNSSSITGAGQEAAIIAYFGGHYTPTQVDFDYYITGSSSWELYEGYSGQSAAIAGTGAWYHATFVITPAATTTNFFVGLRSTATLNGSIVTMDIRMDNIEITTIEGFAYAPILYKVTNFTSTNTWTDISPDDGEAPESPYDFAVDRVDSSILNFVSGRGGNWYKSTDTGASFSTFAASTAYRALYTQGKSIAAGGTDVIALSFSNGSSFVDESGNLDSLWNGIGRCKKVLAL